MSFFNNRLTIIFSVLLAIGIVQFPSAMGLPGKGFLRSILNEASEEKAEDRELDYFAADDDTVATVVAGPNCNNLFCLSGSDCQSGYCLDNQCEPCTTDDNCAPNVCESSVCCTKCLAGENQTATGCCGCGDHTHCPELGYGCNGRSCCKICLTGENSTITGCCVLPPEPPSPTVVATTLTGP